jgi:hypothetical protein
MVTNTLSSLRPANFVVKDFFQKMMCAALHDH